MRVQIHLEATNTDRDEEDPLVRLDVLNAFTQMLPHNSIFETPSGSTFVITQSSILVDGD